MTIIRWRTQPEINRLFGQRFNNKMESNYSETSVPDTNIFKSEDFYTIEMAVPGLSKKDFNIKIEEKVLSVLYEPESNDTADEKTVYLRREFQQEAFSRYFTLPDTTQTEEIAAGYENGILKIKIPYVNPEKNKFTKAIQVN